MLLQGKRVFVVEDNLENRVIIELLLREAGAELAFDRWGRDTVRRVKAFAPVDVILMDLNLPKGMSGFGLFDDIRQQAEFDHVPVIAVSANDPGTAIPQAQAKGFSGFIPKPLDFDHFAGQVAQVIKGETIWKAY